MPINIHSKIVDEQIEFRKADDNKNLPNFEKA
jgi:hypothetical protein